MSHKRNDKVKKTVNWKVNATKTEILNGNSKNLSHLAK